MAQKVDVWAFLCECYLKSEPSIDITTAESIDPDKHALKISDYNALLQKHGVTDKDGNAIDEDMMVGIGLMFMSKGPRWIDDVTTKAA